jgi:rhodanese-related sulfurtransferase
MKTKCPAAKARQAHQSCRRLTPALRWLCSLAAILTVTPVAQSSPAPLRINELMAANGATVFDVREEAEDWIEVHNPNPFPVDLGGHYLSDSLSDLQKHCVPATDPATVIAPHGYALVWASGAPARGPLHTSFRLPAAGAVVVLTAPDGVTVLDAITFGAQQTDVSYGRSAQPAGGWAYFATATPGAPNAGGEFLGWLDPPQFGTPPGFYAAPVLLTVTHPDPGVVLRYTLDGHAPDPSDLVWTGPLLLEAGAETPGPLATIRTTPVEADPKGFGWSPPSGAVARAKVVRVQAVKPGYVPSPIASGTWWIGPELSQRHQLDVVSLLVEPKDFFAHERGIYVPGRIYETNGFGCGFWGQPNANYFQDGPEWERPGHFEFFTADGGIRGAAGDVFLRLHGGGSRAMPAKTLRVYDRSGEALTYPFFPSRPDTAFGRLLLRNSGQDWFRVPTMLKDAWLQRVVWSMDFEKQDYRPAVLYLNGEYWGIHNLRERVDSHYLERLYGVEADEVDLLEKNAVVKEGSAEHYQALINFVSTRSLTVASNYAEVRRRMDVSSFMDLYIAEIFLVNLDWPGNNMDCWRLRRDFDPTAPRGWDGRWRWALYDLDAAGDRATVSTDMFTWLQVPGDYPRQEWAGRLINRLWTSPEFVAEFCTRFADHLNTTFQPDRSCALATELAQAIAGDILEHFRRWGRGTSLAEWQANVQRLRDFATGRPAYVWQHLKAHFPTEGTAWVTIHQPKPQAGHVRINSVHLDGALTPGVPGRPAEWSGRWFRAFPIELEALPEPGWRFVRWQETGQTERRLSVALTSDLEFTPVFEPDVHLLAWGDYVFTKWPADALAGTYPARMYFEQTDEVDPGLAAAMTGFWRLPYNLGSRSRINGLGADGVAFLSTSNPQEVPGAGFVGTAVLALNTLGVEQIQVLWTGGTVVPNDRVYGLRLQYRVGDAGPFVDLHDAHEQPVEYVRHPTAGHTAVLGPTLLPAAAENQPRVELRWKYYCVSGISGARAQLRLDDIRVSGEPQPGWIWHPLFGWLWNSGNGWFGGSAYGWLWFHPEGQWIWTTGLQGWMGITDPDSRTLWSPQFRWLSPAADDASLATTSSLGPIHVGVYHGTLLPDGTPINDGWVVSDRFGYVWAAGDGVWFYTTGYGWLGVTPDGGIWCVNEGKFL